MKSKNILNNTNKKLLKIKKENRVVFKFEIITIIIIKVRNLNLIQIEIIKNIKAINNIKQIKIKNLGKL